uniref:Protein MIS12 homolog n=2 Tax=Felis catus TaxID=9685 RepID=A0ABI7YI48_FELCA
TPVSRGPARIQRGQREAGAAAAHHSGGGEDAGGGVGAADRWDLQVLQPEALVRHLPHRRLPPHFPFRQSAPAAGRGRRGLPPNQRRAPGPPPIARALRKAHRPTASCVSAGPRPAAPPTSPPTSRRGVSVPVPSTNPRRPQLAFPPGPFPGLSEARPRAAGQSGARRRPAWALVRGGRNPPVAGEPAAPSLRGSRRWRGAGAWSVSPPSRSLGFLAVEINTAEVAEMSVDPMAYEAQFFGFTPQTCMLRVYIAFQDYLFEVTQAVEQVILKKLDGIPGCEISPVQIRKCTEKFLGFMKGRFDSLFGKMEQLFLQLVLRIPPNVLLPEDKAQETHPCGEKEFQLLQREIEELQERYKTEARAQQALLAELEEQKIVQAKLRRTLALFDELENAGRDQGTSDFRESLAFLVQNSRKLQNIRDSVEREGKRLKVS